MRPALLAALVLPLPTASAQTAGAPGAVPATRLAPSVVTHVGGDGAGVGVALPLGGPGMARLTVAVGAVTRHTVGPDVCVTWDMCPRSDLRTRSATVAASLLVRGDEWKRARLYAGVDAALRVETQTERLRDLPPGTIEGIPEPVHRHRVALRPGLVAGLDVAVTQRLGVYVERNAVTPLFGSEVKGWRFVDPYTPFRAGAGLRVAW